MRYCSIIDCDRLHYGKEYCQMHYKRVRKNGTPHLRTIQERFWRRVTKTKDCWLWDTPKRDGYGQFAVKRKVYPAHKYSYELLKGPVPEGLILDHLCRNRICVNPDHLEATTQRENVLRGDTVLKRKSNLPIGVTAHRRRFKARKSINGARRLLGIFKTPEEAYMAYLEAK